jgi:hypothetical protein
VNIAMVSTPHRRLEEFRSQVNSLLSDSGRNLKLEAAKAFDAEWTIALHIPQQRLNTTFVLEDLKRQSLLGVHVHSSMQ